MKDILLIMTKSNEKTKILNEIKTFSKHSVIY